MSDTKLSDDQLNGFIGGVIGVLSPMCKAGHVAVRAAMRKFVNDDKAWAAFASLEKNCERMMREVMKGSQP